MEFCSRVKCALCSVRRWSEVCITQSLSVGLGVHWMGLICGMNYAVRGILQQSKLYIS